MNTIGNSEMSIFDSAYSLDHITLMAATNRWHASIIIDSPFLLVIESMISNLSALRLRLTRK